MTGSDVLTLLISAQVHSLVYALCALYLATRTCTQMPCSTYFNPYTSTVTLPYIPLKPRRIAHYITAFHIVSVTLGVIMVN